jgi:hypothetical protein
MKRVGYLSSRGRQGSVLVLSLIFIVMISAMAVGLATMSGSNVQIAENHQKLEDTRACAESGLDVMRYWMSKVEMSGTTDQSQRFELMASRLQSALSDAGVTNVVPVLSGSTITISDVPLNTSRNEKFSAVLTKLSDTNVRLDVTGYNGSISRTIRSEFVFDVRADNVFDFGVASKGPVHLSGNIEMEGANIALESNAYIETDQVLALEIIGNSQIAGTVKITNPSAFVNLQGGQASIGGVSGIDATRPPYTEYGAAPSEFPELRPNDFFRYATNVLSPTADLSGNATYDNLLILPGTNPNFTGHPTLRGVVYIQTPNVVRFTGGVDVTGIIVTNGDSTIDPDPADAASPQIYFGGNVNSYPVYELPLLPQFDGLQDQTGTFMIAPGFRTTFGGTFSAISGAIAANGISMSGNTGGVINGSIVNYSQNPMWLTGNGNLYFNRSGLTEVPAGFVPRIIVRYDPSTYSEVI